MTAIWSLAETRGFSVFPLVQYSKSVAAVRKWGPFMHAPASPGLIADWASRPVLNMAVVTGAISGCFVLDCDDLMARIEAESRGLPDTLTVSTPRGFHFYFNHPGWEISNRAGTLDKIEGLDLRGDGGYVVGPGSYFIPTAKEIADGKIEGAYAIEHDLPIADAPAWLLEMTIPKGAIRKQAEHADAEETSNYGRVALNGEVTKMIECPSGRINDQINLSGFAIGQLRAGGEIVDEEGWGALNEALAVMGLGDEEKAVGTLLRGWEAGLQAPRAAERTEPFDLTAALGTRAMIALDDVPPPPAPKYGPERVPLIIGATEIQEYFRGVVLIGQRNEMFTPSGVLLKPAQFDALYGGPKFMLDDGDGKPTRSAWEMFTKNSHTVMPKAAGACFRPELPSGAIILLEGLPYVNIYVPVVTPRRRGNVQPFLDLVRKMLPNGEDADILLHWMASAVQNPGKKFFWWPVIQGTKGNGKTALLEIMFNAIGERYSHHVNADSVLKTGNQFNDWLVGKLFLGFEEIHSSDGSRHFVEMMKSTVTNNRIATEGKGVGQTTSDNRANGMMLSNWKNACPIDDDERRWGIFFTAQQKAEDLVRDGMNGEYFPRFYEWLRAAGQPAVTYFLANMPLRAELDPARGLHRAPRTSSTDEAIIESRGTFEQEIVEAIEEGRVGFSEEVIAGSYVKNLARDLKKTIPPKRFAAIMESVGYVRHPALASNKGRVPGALNDGGRPVLYFLHSSHILKIMEPGEIRDAVNMAIFPAQTATDNVVPLRR